MLADFIVLVVLCLGSKCDRVGSLIAVLVGSFTKCGGGWISSYVRNCWGDLLGIFFYVSTFLHALRLIIYSQLRS